MLISNLQSHTTIEIADLTVIITTLNADEASISLFDTSNTEPDKSHAFLQCTTMQASAIIFLMIHGDMSVDEFGDRLIHMLYLIAEPVLSDLPPNLRPIP